MTTVKRLFILLFVLLGYTTGAWAIEQDSDGYYLIGSVQDWKDFAALVQTTPTANAKMTADVDLGDDQTRIGDVAGNEYGAKFGGIFDGQGHTLTVAYNITGQNMCAPFTKTNGATIKNLHVAGTMRTEFCHLAGIIADAYGNNTIENVWVSADLTSANNYNSGGRILDLCGAFVGCKKTGTLSISNGLFSGSITTENGSIWNGAFLGYIDGENQSSATITNCLSVGTFSYIEHETTIPNRGTNTYCYVKQFPTTIPSEMRVTDEQLADGTIATALGDAWVQDPLTHQPTLKIFATLKQDSEGYYLIGSVQDWQNFAAIVETTPTANAKMTADVDLGDDQTKIGIVDRRFYSGTFDGQGHTLTINYTHDAANVNAPFPDINNATIKDIHIAGTINSLDSQPAPIGLSRGTCTVKNMWSSLEITSSPKGSKWQESSGIVGLVISGTLTISDCVFTGSNTSSGSYNGCFVGYINSGNAIITNCLSLGEFNYTGSSPGFRGSHNNCYVYQFPTSYPNGVSHISDSDISDGTITTALQADRSEEIWVQDPVLGIPMLKIFANEETEQPSEALNGVFTINASGEKVSFAKGNLQKIGSTYQFAEHQYDYFGTDQSDTHRDMYAFLDYSNPDNGESWSMLSRDEWGYLFATRGVTNTLSADARYTMATLGGTYKGLIIFPDNYTHPEGTGFTSGVFNSNSNYTAQVSLEGWAMMEAAGCVFLPAAGYCSRGSTWVGVGNEGSYMSTTPDGSNNYYDPYFTPNSVNLYESSSQRTWSSIRLVLRLQPLTYTVPASGVGTFSSEVNIHLPEGLSAHYCKTYYAERSAISVVNIRSGVVPANTGVLLSGTPGETFNLYPTPETADELEGNTLVPVTKPVHINPTKGDYTNFMMKGDRFVKIADESYTVKMPANRAYLPLLTSAISGSNVKEIMLYWDDEEATGIERMRNVENEIMRKGNIYNLNGQKLSSPLKGINIINGRKVIVK